MKHTETYQEGANDERTAILARLRRDQRAYERNSPTTSAGILSYMGVIIDWIQGRTDRNNAKPGGLGKKAKVKQSLILSPKSLAAKIKDAKKSFPAANGEGDSV